MTKDEALKLAQCALSNRTASTKSIYEAITAIKEALARPEPVLQDIEQYRMQMAGICTAALGYWTEYDSISSDYDTVALRDVAKLYAKYDALYKARWSSQPAQEPLEYWNAVEGWVKVDEVRKHFDSAGCGTIYKTAGEDRVPLYTSPPQREWVGLTDQERFALHSITAGSIGYAKALEAALKEKNT